MHGLHLSVLRGSRSSSVPDLRPWDHPSAAQPDSQAASPLRDQTPGRSGLLLWQANMGHNACQSLLMSRALRQGSAPAGMCQIAITCPLRSQQLPVRFSHHSCKAAARAAREEISLLCDGRPGSLPGAVHRKSMSSPLYAQSRKSPGVFSLSIILNCMQRVPDSGNRPSAPSTCPQTLYRHTSQARVEGE